MNFNSVRSLFICLFFGLSITSYGYSHGIIENPPSREYFCGNVTRPHDVESPQLAHEECRPILKKDGKYNNDIYNFMSVLSHSRGYYNNSNLPVNVCGYDSESFKGGPTPWDAPINWPVNKMTPGPQNFVWNISWGPHFSDTEEFKYWITKPDFQFDSNKALQWSDLEKEPFCDIGWDDNEPNKNPDIKADKENAKFSMTCTVPPREGRHIIYAEWGRSPPTDERFHSCIDVNFTDQPIGTVVASIASLPVKEYYGEGMIELDGSQSSGENLKYEWIVNSSTPNFYTITNGDQARATLTFSNPTAEQQVTVILHVTNTEGSSDAEIKFNHLPEVQTNWIDLGPLVNEQRPLNVGDEVSVRAIQKNGTDLYFPATPLVITEELKAPDAWPRALAEAINKDDNPIMLGNIEEAGNAPLLTPQVPEMRIYALNSSDPNTKILNAYLQVKTPSTPPDETPSEEIPANERCTITLQNGNSEWWAGIEIGTDLQQFTLDFSQTGLDLTKVNLDQGVFKATIDGQMIRVTEKPSWVNATNKGYMGFNASNYSALKSFQLPTCVAE